MLLNTSKKELSKDELIKLVESPLLDAISKELEMKEEVNRQTQIAMARRDTLYMAGKQYLYPTFSRDGRTLDWKQVDGDGSDKSNKKRHFANTFNIIYADGIKFVSVVSQRQLNMKCVPDDPMVQQQVMTCKEGDAAIAHLNRYWNTQRKAVEISHHLWATSAVYLNTEYATNKRLHGSISVPQFEYVPEELFPAGYVCTNCGTVAMANECPACQMPLSPLNYQDAISIEVPYANGVKEYPKGNVDLNIYTTFEVSHSFAAKSRDDMDWLSLDLMEPKWRIQSQYEIDDESDNSGFGDRASSVSIMEAEMARQDVESPGGACRYDAVNNLWLHSRKWIMPEVYHALPLTQRKVMREKFPDGVKLCIVGDKLVKMEAQALSDAWAVIKTGTGPYVTSAPLCQNIIPNQDAINNFFNMGEETLLRHIPKTFVDASLIDPEVQKENEALVGELIRVKLKSTERLSDMMGQLPMARMSDQMMPFAASLREYARDSDGIQPAIFGGGEAAPTFRQEQQRKNQALMQLAPTFVNIQNGMVDATKNALKQLAKYGVGQERIPSKDPMTPSLTLTIANLQESGYEVEAVESDAQTIPEKQERISTISQENPGMASALGWDDPMNIVEMNRIFGVDGLFAPGVSERNRAIAKIQELLVAAPVQQQDPMTGQMIEVSSIPADDFELKNATVFAKVYYAWCIGDAGVEMERVNTLGFNNVKLHWLEIDQAAQAQMMPPPEEGGAPPSDEPPPPESELPPLE